MKIIHTKNPVGVADLKQFLETKLTPLFKQQRQADIDFVYTQTTKGVQITQPDLYDDFLFDITVASPTELHISKSEHYTDDVNALTLENIMNDMFMQYPGRDDVTTINDR